MKWHILPLTKIKEILHSDLNDGLSEKEARDRFARYGANEFSEKKVNTLFNIITKQLKSPLVMVLIVAGAATFFLEEYLDMTVIFVALLINIIIGATQEKRADRAFKKLKKSQQKYATVIRDGKRKLIPLSYVVVGDVIIVDAGSFVPADARIITSSNLSVDESAITGEWVEVRKSSDVVNERAHIGEQTNMIWMGTLVTSGSVQALVIATGDDTEVGKIAGELLSRESKTPLQKSIHKLALYMTAIIFIALVFILLIGLWRGESMHNMLLVAIAIAVAAMPEGLPAAVTVVLAIGMESILKKKGLVRNLLAAETLGSTTVILTDKTGTLTKAKMRLASIVTYLSLKNHNSKNKGASLVNNSDERDVLAMALLTSNAFIEGYDDALAEWVIRGGPFERAIMLAGIESGMDRDKLLTAYPQIDTIPFESERRFSASLHYIADLKKHRLYLTGAPELLLDRANYIYKKGKKIKLSKHMKEELRAVEEEKTSQGSRLIAVAYKETELEKFSLKVRDDESELLDKIVFCGFVVIHDPLRKDIFTSIKEARDAGTRVIMVTGDNKNTARRIAIEAGISSVSGKVVSGDDMEELSDAELLEKLRSIRIFARILPRQKMRLVKVLKNAGEVVAMTGDGINDAPALRRADIGIALGSGTEIAKESSDIILLNNSFTVIVRAIEEGRRILDNLKKIVAYLLSTSFGEIFLVSGALLFGAQIPLTAAQILWTNIVQEGFMNFAFAFEPKQADVMKRNPASSSMKRILTKDLRSLILIIGLVTGMLLTSVYFILLKMNLAIGEIRTTMFMLLSFGSILFSLSLKDLSRPLWKINLFSNKYLIFALITSISVLFLALYVPFLQTLLSLEPVGGLDLLFMLLVGIFNILIIEGLKYIYFVKKKK